MEPDLRYPIGQAETYPQLAEDQRESLIETVAQMPARLAAAVRGLMPAQLDTPYRPRGWTVRQVTHHLADSHMNGFIRMKLALTEDEPTVKPYDEARWAETAEVRNAPVDTSLALLENLHARWVLLMRSLSSREWSRKLNHPERGVSTLDENLCYYAWHCRHHVTHITALRERNGWR